MLRNYLIKLFGGYTANEIGEVRQSKRSLTEQVRLLEPYREFANSVSVYVGNYPAWKAQSEYREVLRNLGQPLSGEYPSSNASYPTHAENVDLYLGRLVDGLSELNRQVPGSVPGTYWDSPEDLASARGEVFLKRSILPDLSARIDRAEAEAMRGCGLSDVLYEKLVQAEYESILHSALDSEKAKVEAVLRERGYDPGFTPYEAGEGECEMTGIEIDCCPCGRHP